MQIIVVSSSQGSCSNQLAPIKDFLNEIQSTQVILSHPDQTPEETRILRPSHTRDDVRRQGLAYSGNLVAIMNDEPKARQAWFLCSHDPATIWNNGPRCCPNLLARLGFISLPRSPSKIKGSVLVQPEIAQEVSDCSTREENSNLLVSPEERQHGAEFFPLTSRDNNMPRLGTRLQKWRPTDRMKTCCPGRERHENPQTIIQDCSSVYCSGKNLMGFFQV